MQGASTDTLEAKTHGLSVARETQLIAQTDTKTMEVRTFLSNKGTLLGNLLLIFSQSPAHRQPLDTERRRRLATKIVSSLREGFNEERGRGLQVNNLLIALSYCVGVFFFVLFSSISLNTK